MISIKQLANETGITTRTLRYYDSIGLLKPGGTTEGGHRLYSEKDVIKLQQIQFLKRMGFRLTEIQELLENRRIEPLQYLNHQLQVLREQQRQLKKMERDVLGAIHSYRIEGKLDWALLYELIRLSQQDPNRKAKLKDKIFNKEEQKLFARLPNLSRDDEQVKRLLALINQAQTMLCQDPASPEAQELAEAFTRIGKTVCEGDEGMIQKIWEIRKSPEASREMGWYPLDPELIAFLDRAFSIYDARRNAEETGDRT